MDTIITGGVSIPRLGFGALRMPGEGCQPVVESALALEGPAPRYAPSRPTETR
jgi:hypothetical protein